jgi:hypothetical protein
VVEGGPHIVLETFSQADNTELIIEPTNGRATNRAHPVVELEKKSPLVGPKLVPMVASVAARFREGLPSVSDRCRFAVRPREVSICVERLGEKIIHQVRTQVIVGRWPSLQ